VKIFYLTNLLTPYRIEWINMLSYTHQIEAYYLYDSDITREKDWLTYSTPMFKTKKASAYKLYHNSPTRSFLRVLRSREYDACIIDGYSSLFKLKVLQEMLRQNVTVLVNVDGIDIWKRKSFSDYIKDQIKYKVFRSGAYFLCGSRIAADAIIDCGADRDKVCVHPFTSLHKNEIITIEEKRSLQEQYKKKLHRENQKVALGVGRFIPLKKYECLIRAWKDMPDDCYLYLIGGGELKEKYEKLIRDLDIRNIELLDFILPEKLNEYFYAADLFVHPSSTETWGLVINEAMAKGCPVIATYHCVSAVELIRDGIEGYLTAVGDEDDLKEKMTAILNDDALRADMSANVIERIQPYTYENMADIHLKLLERIKNDKR